MKKIFKTDKHLLFEINKKIYIRDLKTKKTTQIADLNIEQKKESVWNKEFNKWEEIIVITGKPSVTEAYDGLTRLRDMKTPILLQELYVDYCSNRRTKIEDNYAFKQVFIQKNLQEL